jgi:HAD superfamily phosphoserine phosphatase-like hydrolase
MTLRIAIVTKDITPSLDTSWRDGFVFADQAATDKAAQIIAAGGDTLAFIFDWDGVITPNDPHGIAGTNWAVLKRNMSPQNLERHQELYRQFRPLEEAGGLTPEAAEGWQRQAMELLVGTSIEAIEEDARRSNVELRPGMKEFFAVVQQANIPVFIKSAGECHIIEAVANHHGFKPTKIFSNEFSVDDNGIITGVHEHTITHNLNKHTFSHRTTNGHEARSTAIVVGDNPHDTQMIGDEVSDVTLKIRIDVARDTYIERYSLKAWDEYLQRSFAAGYDMVAVDDDVSALIRLTRTITNKKSP